MCIRDRFPDVKQVGLLYCSAEANSLYQIQLFEAALDKDGIAYKEYAILSLIHIFSVLVIDIDDFRKVNDGLGIVAGDELVQQFGSFLKEFNSDDVIV